MRWGVRRFQNEDGSLTPAGESRYNRGKMLDKASNAIDRFKKSSEKYKHHSNNEIKRLGTKYSKAVKGVTKKCKDTTVKDIKNHNKGYNKQAEDVARSFIIGAAAVSASIALVGLMSYASPEPQFDAREYVRKTMVNSYNTERKYNKYSG